MKSLLYRKETEAKIPRSLTKIVSRKRQRRDVLRNWPIIALCFFMTGLGAHWLDQPALTVATAVLLCMFGPPFLLARETESSG